MIKTLWRIYKIIKWHKRTFQKYTFDKQLQKICEEIFEWESEFLKLNTDKELEELTDVIIASIGAMRFKEVREMVKEKMKANQKRRWKNGHHY